jgi:hypothetical protein
MKTIELIDKLCASPETKVNPEIIFEAANRLEKFEAALYDVWMYLAPVVPACIICEGCRYEWEHALKTIMETLEFNEQPTI